MNISKVAECISNFFAKMLNHRCRILSIMPKENGWEAMCEMDIDPDYTTRRGLSDIVEVYDVFVSKELEVEGFVLKETKRKAALDKE
jgi:hypothetical protein